mgnify:FL=1
MTLGSAALLLLLSAVGIAASRVCLRQKSALGTVCLVVCALAALAAAAYIGLTLFFVDAAANQPPAV